MNDTMKKILIIIIALTFVISAYSCGSGGAVETAETEETSVSDGYKPYDIGVIGGDYIFGEGSGAAIMKYNVHNGEATFLCPDPFCAHDSENCQFYRVQSDRYAAVGNLIYYIRTDHTTGKIALYSFDIDAAKTKAVYSGEYLMNVYSYGYSLFIRASDGIGCGAEDYYFWYDTKTGKTERYDAGSVPEGYTLLYIRDGRVIWRPLVQGEESVYYVTDLIGNKYFEQDLNYKCGKYYSFDYEQGETGPRYYTLYVSDTKDGEKRVVLKDVGAWTFYNDKIFFTKPLPPDEYAGIKLDAYGVPSKDREGGNVYVMNSDGTEQRLLFHTDKYISGVPGVSSNRFHPLFCGNYIGMDVYSVAENGEYVDEMIIADITTGNFVYVQK